MLSFLILALALGQLTPGSSISPAVCPTDTPSAFPFFQKEVGTGTKGDSATVPWFDLKAALDSVVAAYAAPGWRTGIAVISCTRDTLLYGHNSKQPITPASNQKLLVTTCALEHWDPGLVRELDARLDSTRLRAHIHRANRKLVDSLGLDAHPEFAGYRHLVLANRESDNAEAEWMLSALGRRHRTNPVALLRCFLDEKSVERPGLRIADACGRSHDNRVAPVTLARLLVRTYQGPSRDLFISTLAKPGRPGTLIKRNLDAGPRVAAKTGYIRGVFSLSGYLSVPTDTLAFSFIVNRCSAGTPAYTLFNALLNTLYRWAEGEPLNAGRAVKADTGSN